MLTKEHIQFTDRYLEKSGVRYVDIRYEMTDHVATALENREGDFYENFRQYMVQHKQELMQSNHYFKKLALRRAFGIFKTNVLKPAFWIIAFVIFATAKSVNQFGVSAETIITNMEMSSLIISSIIYFYFIYYWMFKKEVHSVLMRLLLIIYFGNIIGIARMIHNTNFLIVYYALYIAFYILLIQSVYQLNQQYRLKYNV